MSAEYNDQLVDNVNLNLEIKENQLQIKDGSLHYQNHSYNIDGFSPNFFDQQISGMVRSDNIPVSSFKDYLPEQLFNGSNVKCHCREVSGKGLEPQHEFSF